MKATHRKAVKRGLAIAIWMVAIASAAWAQGGKPLERCPIDSVPAGAVCMDKYEATVWLVPNPRTANKSLVERIRRGYAAADELIARGATLIASSAGSPCAANGSGCASKLFAVSLPGLLPASGFTWFEAQQACKNSRKRLPTNAEWQMAVAGTPDPGPDDGVTTCNTASAFHAVGTGSRTACKSARGAFDMVGNLHEWVAEWMPRSTACGSWTPMGSPTGDSQCFAGAASSGEPGALARGGGYEGSPGPGPLAVRASDSPFTMLATRGFRCAR